MVELLVNAPAGLQKNLVIITQGKRRFCVTAALTLGEPRRVLVAGPISDCYPQMPSELQHKIAMTYMR